ncbi:hypothetical protein ASG55_01315 [Pseudomonas sp. Leaf434]|nr:hypothetical protein ASG55_01315 [Pseudomonas sp. Leaf434]
MRGGTLLAFIQEKPGSIAGRGAEGERGRSGGDLNVGAAEGCDLLILFFLKAKSKDRSLR